jgi:hypothetical protein
MIEKPKIHVFTICYNEEKIIPFFLDHYKYADKITVYDNESTDSSRDLLLKDPRVELITYQTDNKLHDGEYVRIKESCWKNTDCEYAIIVDMDEFVYHPNIKDFLMEDNHAAYKPKGYNMISEVFPENGTLTEKVNMGVKDSKYSKLCILNTKKVESIKYKLGCHESSIIMNNPEDKVIHTNNLKLLHYKNLSFDYRFKKHEEYRKRRSEFNNREGAGTHYLHNEEKQRKEFEKILLNMKKVI